MPLVQIDLDRALFKEKGQQISSEIHLAQVEIDELAIPMEDKFQVFRTHDDGEIIGDPGYNGVDRRQMIVIQMLMVNRYPVALKNRLFRNIARRLAGIGIRPEDVFIAVSENGYEDWLPGILESDIGTPETN
jgi:hypothetical protein